MIGSLFVARSNRLGDEHSRSNGHRAQNRQHEKDKFSADADAGDGVVADPADEQRIDRADRSLQQILANNGERKEEHDPLGHCWNRRLA